MIRRLRIIRNPELTLANLLDELLPVSGDCLTSRELDGQSSRDLRFSDVYREVCAMSRFLVEAAGLGRGERVAIWKTNDRRCFAWFLAVIRAGGVAVPLNPLLPLAEAKAIMARCGVSILVTDAALFETSIQSRDALPLSRLVQGGGEAPLDGFLRFTPEWLDAPLAPPASVTPTDTVAVFYSSGTEGSPKGALLSSQALLAGRAVASLSAALAGRRAMALFTLPWAHIMAVSTAVYGLLAGVPACLLRRFEVPAAIAAIESHRINVVVGVPAMFIRLINAAPAPESLASVELWVSASDHLPGFYRRRLLQYGALVRGPGRFRIRPLFLNAYGMVELGGIALFGLDAPFLPGDGELCLPVPPLRVRVADEQGRATPAGVAGECQISGPGVTGRYWDNSGGTSEPLAAGGWLRTGDLAVRDRLGFVRLTGRAKDVIKCGGYSVYASEVEEALASHPAVARAAVIGVPHPDKGEAPVAVLECRAGFSPAEDELLAWCRSRLAAYKVPRRVHQVDPGSLPQGVTEKVLKRVLRERYASDFGASRLNPNLDYQGPQTHQG